MIEVYQIPRDQFDEYWPHIEGYMERAAKYTYGRFKVQDIRNMLNEDNYELWVALNHDKTVEGAVITTIYDYPQMNTLAMLFCAGINGHKWKDAMLVKLREYARLTNCSKLEATARKGWLGIFKDDGYKAQSVMFELPV